MSFRNKKEITGKITSNNRKSSGNFKSHKELHDNYHKNNHHYTPTFEKKKHQLNNVSTIDPLTGNDPYANLRKEPLPLDISVPTQDGQKGIEYTIGIGRKHLHKDESKYNPITFRYANTDDNIAKSNWIIFTFIFM